MRWVLYEPEEVAPVGTDSDPSRHEDEAPMPPSFREEEFEPAVTGITEGNSDPLF